MTEPKDYIQQIKDEKRWHKKAQLICLYHSLCQSKYGTKRPSGWTIERTARELGLSKGYISESIHIAKRWPERPEDIDSREKALKFLNSEKK